MPEAANPNQTDHLREAVEHFKATGQVDFEAMDYAKQNFLPSHGIPAQEVQTLGPVEVMIKLQEILGKDNSHQETKVNPPIPSATPNPTPVEKPNSPASQVNIGEELEELTHKLTSQIDEEIKRQLASQHSLDQAQEHISTIASQLNETPAQPKVEAPKVTLPSAALPEIKIGTLVNDWVVKKLPNETSNFYELENEKGSTWTVSQEEMANLLKTAKVSSETTPAPAPTPVAAPIAETPKPATQTTTASANLDEKQVTFLKKLLKDKAAWQTFTSFTPEQWKFFYDAYSNGNLNEIGIAADILSDHLENQENFTTATINKGDNVYKLLETAGFNVAEIQNNTKLLALHFFVNYDLVEKAYEKIESSGISLPDLPNKDKVLQLAKNNDLTQIKNALTFLPVEARFKLVKPTVYTEIEKLI